MIRPASTTRYHLAAARDALTRAAADSNARGFPEVAELVDDAYRQLSVIVDKIDEGEL